MKENLSALPHAALTPHQIRADVATELGIAPEEIAPHEELLMLGLDSIRLMMLFEHWAAFGAAVSYTELLQEPTLSGIIRRLCPGASS